MTVMITLALTVFDHYCLGTNSFQGQCHAGVKDDTANADALYPPTRPFQPYGQAEPVGSDFPDKGSSLKFGDQNIVSKLATPSCPHWLCSFLPSDIQPASASASERES